MFKRRYTHNSKSNKYTERKITNIYRALLTVDCWVCACRALVCFPSFEEKAEKQAKKKHLKWGVCSKSIKLPVYEQPPQTLKYNYYKVTTVAL